MKTEFLLLSLIFSFTADVLFLKTPFELTAILFFYRSAVLPSPSAKWFFALFYRRRLFWHVLPAFALLFLAYKKQPPYGGRLFLYRTADLESVQFFYGETKKYAHSAANLPCHASCLRSERRIFQSAPLLW